MTPSVYHFSGSLGDRRNQHQQARRSRRGHEIAARPAGDHDADIGFRDVVFGQGLFDDSGDFVVGPGQRQVDLAGRIFQPVDMGIQKIGLAVVGSQQIKHADAA